MVSTLPTLCVCVCRRPRLEELPSDNGSGLEHDFQIKQDRHALEIEQVHRDHLVERRFVLAVYLPVSGQARQTVHAFSLPRLIMGKFIWRARPRTNQTHLAAKHVENLRQLIQATRTKNSPERGQAWVAASIQLRHRTIDPDQFFQMALVRLCLSAQLHCPELPDKKMSSAKADAFLPIENRTRRSDSRHQHKQNHQRQPDRQRKQNAGNIESGFPAGPAQRRCREFARSARRSVPVRARQILRRWGSDSPLNQVKHQRILVPPDPRSAASLADSVQFTVGHAAALGRSPEVWRETVYPHLVNFFTASTSLTPKGC